MDVHDLLRKCRDQFEEYENSHHDKADRYLAHRQYAGAIESLRKAITNREMVKLVDSVIGPPQSSAVPPAPDTPGPYDVI